MNHPHLEGPEEMVHTCSLDVAEDNGNGMTLEQIGELLGLTAERVRQIEEGAMIKIKGLKTKP